MRKLASIQKIVDIRPIDGADKIEVAQVLGWEVVVAKRDEFKVGDLVIYIEIDSIVPDKPEFDFLRDRKFRVRTIKLRKQVSQGLILPLSILPSKNYKEGDDVTDTIGVKKYDPQGDLEAKLMDEEARKSKGKVAKYLSKFGWFRKLFSKTTRYSFPAFIKKTDEDRIQLFPHICEKEKDTIFSVTEKLDGQSGTFFLLKQKKFFLTNYIFGVCSRNYQLKEDNSSYWEVARKYNIEQVLKDLIGKEDYVVLQGEVMGEGIQQNKYRIKGKDLYIFNLIYPKGSVHSLDAKTIIESKGLKFVPILENNFKLCDTIQQMVEYAKGNSTIANVKREGVVIRNYSKKLSFKVINPEFLLKYEE
jgi:hypothetical protein